MYEVPKKELGEGRELMPSEGLRIKLNWMILEGRKMGWMELVWGCAKKNGLKHLNGPL